MKIRDVIILAVLAVAMVGVPAVASAKKPPSFAAWVLQWKTTDDKALAGIDGCAKIYASNDLKAGTCAVKVALAGYKLLMPIWNHQVAKIARGQSAPCRAAIHRYWLAGRKIQLLLVVYFKQHPSEPATKLSSDFDEDPLKTLGDLSDEAKSDAIRVCG